MKGIKIIILFILLLFNLNVYANACSYKEQMILNNDFSNVKITYEVVNDNQINILIYNITENICLSYINPDTEVEEQICEWNTEDGKYKLERNANNIEQYQFKIRSNISSCYGNILTTKTIIKPKYNEYSTLNICNNEKLSNHSYCQKFITTEITKTESEVIKTLEEFLNAKVDKITTKKTEETKKINLKKVFEYSGVGLIIIASVVIFLLIKKRRGEL